MSPSHLVAEFLGDPRITWAIGTLGAIAEFCRDPNEPATISTNSISTQRGGVSVNRSHHATPLAWERPVADGRWTHGVVFFLSDGDAGMSKRSAITEIGPDANALNPAHRDAILFDLGIGAPHCDVCVRTADRELVRDLRASAGQPLFASGLVPRLTETAPDRVFISRLGRIEVRTPIPRPDGHTPDGPHTHVLPDLLKSGRTHPATLPLPERARPCIEAFPPPAWEDRPGNEHRTFNREHYEQFQSLLAQCGDVGCQLAKQETIAAVRAGSPPRENTTYSRKQRLARRVALRQLRQIDGPTSVLFDWIRAFDRPEHAHAD